MKEKNKIENTFMKYREVVSSFVNDIVNTSPDYIVPVEKKGCKLLRATSSNDDFFIKRIRYLQFFLNTNINLSGVKIAVIDDASKYTSMLYKYRDFFEGRGAIVSTYSFVGQKKLETAEREKYDAKAKIYSFLEESTYQEYILQQSNFLSSLENCFDIDHFVIKVNFSLERYQSFLLSLNNIGEIEFTNDVYTPNNIEKFCLFNFDLPSADSLFKSGVNKDKLQIIRFAYNVEKQTLTIAPMSFAIWDSNVTDKNTLFENVPFELPYDEKNEYVSNDGIYFNISFAFHVCLLKSFLNHYLNYNEFNNLTIEEKDLKAYVGIDRAEKVKKSAIAFLKNNEIVLSHASNPQEICIPQKKANKFSSIDELMNELRSEYEKLVNNAKTLLDVRYFLSYKEIFARYEGRANLMKWIDILCDRGGYL